MPFDDTSRPVPDLSLAVLSDILRDQSRWPPGFKWDYGDCDACAMGMAASLWPTAVVDTNEENMAKAFGMPLGAALEIFCYAVLPVFDNCVELSRITPEHVADAIDAYIAKEASHAV